MQPLLLAALSPAEAASPTCGRLAAGLRDVPVLVSGAGHDAMAIAEAVPKVRAWLRMLHVALRCVHVAWCACICVCGVNAYARVCYGCLFGFGGLVAFCPAHTPKLERTHKSRSRLNTGAATGPVCALLLLLQMAMLFVRCRGGVSHSPLEHVEPHDVTASSAALAAYLWGRVAGGPAAVEAAMRAAQTEAGSEPAASGAGSGHEEL